MNVVILNGSPRKAGKVSQMLHLIEDDAVSKKAGTVQFFNVNELSFKSCTGCMKCRNSGSCVLPEDDAHAVARAVKDCDVIVVGTPVYWANMSGELKSLFDRLVGVLMGESPMGIPKPLHKGKKALVVTACTTPFPFNILCAQSTKAVASVKEILVSSGFKIKRTIVVAGTKQKNELPEHIRKKLKLKC